MYILTSSGGSPLISTLINGVIARPTHRMQKPITLYSFLYKAIKAETFFISLSAIGLYMLATIALANPRSAKFNTCKTELYKLLRPKYSSPSVFINIVRTINGNRILTTLLIIPNPIFRNEFFVLELSM